LSTGTKGLLKVYVIMTCDFHGIRAEMYGDRGGSDGEYTIPIGVADIKREGTDVTIVSRKNYKEAYIAAEELAKENFM
jgi:pyruvate/2-oxoglutarate/acetoin dehydrogenase E1 component